MTERELKWKRLSERVDELGGNGKEIVAAYKDLYSVHDKRMISWLAKLFDPDIGGFYYSNSGRDNEYIDFKGKRHYFLPDIESTIQAINHMYGLGLINDFKELPEWMREKIKNFTISLQDKDDGYFYHKQWGKNIGDNRRGRDLMWAVGIARKLGFEFPYPTAYQRLEVAQKDDSAKAELVSAFPPHLQSEKAFREYMNSFDWENEAYSAGNKIAAQVKEISAAGLTDIAVEVLNSHQRPDTGIWGNATDYDAVNGILKISCFYDSAKRPIPNPLAVAMTAMDTIESDSDCVTVCYQYNTWYSVGNVINNLRAHGGAEGNELADKIRTEMFKRAPSGLRKTAEKAKLFLCDDGSYSYCQQCTSATSQGQFVAAVDCKEGDVNATGINSTGTIGYSYSALGLSGYGVGIFDKSDYQLFLDNLRLPKGT